MKYIVTIITFLFISSNAYAYREKVPAWKYNKTVSSYNKQWKKYNSIYYTHKNMAKKFNSVLKKKNKVSREIMPIEKEYDKLKKKFRIMLQQVNKEPPLYRPTGPIVVAIFDNGYIKIKKKLKRKYFRFTRKDVSDYNYDKVADTETKLIDETKRLKEEYEEMRDDLRSNRRKLKPLKKLKFKLKKKLPHLQKIWKQISTPKNLEVLKVCKVVQCFIPGYHNVHVPFVTSY